MKKQIRFSSLVGIASLLVSTQGFASPVSDLESYFQQNISSFDQKLCSMVVDNASTTPEFTLADVNVQVSAVASFGITSVLDLSISPEIDFMVTPAVSP